MRLKPGLHVAHSAVQRVCEHRFVVVLDIDLGDGSGIDLRHRLTATGNTVPVIYMTGNDSPSVREAALRSGCLAYLTKPFSSRELIEPLTMSDRSEPKQVCRRNALTFLGYAGMFGLVASSSFFAASEAVAQTTAPAAAPTTPPADAPKSGTERRQEPRSGRTERRQERRTGRAERRQERRTGRDERRDARDGTPATTTTTTEQKK